MKKAIFIVISMMLVGTLLLSCSKDEVSDKELKVTTLDGSGTWNNPFKVPVGKTRIASASGGFLYEFPYSIGQSYTIKVSNFTQNLDLRVVIGYGPNLGTDLANSVTEGLTDEELTYTFSQGDLLLYIENVTSELTEFTLSITKN
jgi:hypothetical protein